MISGALTRRAKELTEQGAAFVIATVVRVQRPTSVELGDAALVLGDGTIEGFVGGVCAQHSVRLYSLKTLQSGEPLLLRILPDPEQEAESVQEDPSRTRELSNEEGTVTVQNPCLSGGAMEMFLEPVLPAPRVLVAGDSPIVDALQRIGPEVGVAVVSAGEGPGARIEPAPGDLALVVAAHGRDEGEILRAALAAKVPYVGLVASPKRGRAVLEQLHADGVGKELLGVIDTPAGLDIGARTAPEIALSILARIVEVRRSDPHSGRRGTIVPQPVTAVDPICGMTVVVGEDTQWSVHGDKTTYFCCLGCKLKFEEQRGNPALAS